MDRSRNATHRSGLILLCLIALGVLFLWGFLARPTADNRVRDNYALFRKNIPEHLADVQTLYVMPGGGSGAGVDGVKDGYPEWSRRRVVAAHDHFKRKNRKSLFLALSAGSLNTANALHEDGRVKFECQHMIEHLVELGVPRQSVLGDFMSWDTVTNALYLRMVVSGVMAAQRKSVRHGHKLDVEVFISDFHADRVQAAFNWVMGLRPSLLPHVELVINKVSSEGIEWPNKDTFDSRLAHEQKGVEQIKANAETIKSVEELYAFITLGPHRGFFDYMHHRLPLKKGGGW